MSELDQIIRSELERFYPEPNREPEWQRVLDRAPDPEQPAPRRWSLTSMGRRRLALATILCAAAVAAGVSITAPWRSQIDLVGRALAAIGSGRYVHAVLETNLPFDRVIDLQTGSSVPVVLTVDYVLDSKTSDFTIVTSIQGAPTGKAYGSPDPGLAAFVSGYRSALANRAVRVVGKTIVAGHKAKILRFSAGSDTEDLAVDSSTYRPLWIRYGSLRSSGHVSIGPRYRIIAIGSTKQPPAQRGSNRGPMLSGGYADIRSLTPTQASRQLGRAPLWLGRSFVGLTLVKVRLQRVTTLLLEGFRPRSSARGLALDYVSAKQSLEIQEVRTPEAGYGFYGPHLGRSGPLPNPPKASLSCAACGPGNHAPQYHPTWEIQLRRAGLYLTIRGSSGRLLVSTARHLKPIR